MNETLFDRTFRDDEGNLAIAQKPNLPAIVWGTATLLSFLPLPSVVVAALNLLAFGAIFTWAWLELFQGVNYFRRSLGLIVFVLIFGTKLSF